MPANTNFKCVFCPTGDSELLKSVNRPKGMMDLDLFKKVVDDRSVSNTDPVRNKIETRHVSGTNYTDVIVTCLLDYGEPAGQDAFDTATDQNSLYVFDELGLKAYAENGDGRLLTHVVFHPVQKSLNRLIQIDYTVRVQSLTGFNEG